MTSAMRMTGYAIAVVFGVLAHASTLRGDASQNAAKNADRGTVSTKSGEPNSCVHHEPLASDAPLPGQSLYHLKAALTDQYGKRLTLDSFRGHPVLITMFYSSCTSICPMLIAQLQRIDALLPASQRAETSILLVSLDPERDTPAKLLALEQRHGVDGKRWHFTRSDSSVRKISALLGVRYQRLVDGQIAHSPLIAVLDRDGVLVARAEGTSGDPNALVTAIQRVSSQSLPKKSH